MDSAPTVTTTTVTTPGATQNAPTPITVPAPHRTWRRIGIGVFGIAVLLFVWRWAVNHLYSLPEHSIAAFASLTTSLFYTISVIVVFIVTGLTFFSWTASSSIASSVIQQLGARERQKKEDHNGDNQNHKS